MVTKVISKTHNIGMTELLLDSVWTKFEDMYSGGLKKLDAETIWIEANEDDAVEIFENIFGRNPYNVTCSRCGEDYYIYECQPDFGPGDIVVTKQDIENFNNLTTTKERKPYVTKTKTKSNKNDA